MDERIDLPKRSGGQRVVLASSIVMAVRLAAYGAVGDITSRGNRAIESRTN